MMNNHFYLVCLLQVKSLINGKAIGKFMVYSELRKVPIAVVSLNSSSLLLLYSIDISLFHLTIAECNYKLLFIGDVVSLNLLKCLLGTMSMNAVYVIEVGFQRSFNFLLSF